VNWYSVGLAAASGGIAALIASLVFGKKPEKKTAYTIVVVILFVGLNALSKQFIFPELNAHKAKADIESAFSDIPAFASIKKYEPAIYQNLVDSLTDATKQGFDQQQAIDLVRSQISGLVESRMPHASDEAILTYMNVLVTEMGELQGKGGGLCYKLLFPQVGGGVDGRKAFSQETQNNDLLALDEVIKTSNTKRAIPPESAVMPYLEPVFVSLYSKFGDDVSMIENPTASNVDKRKVCSITMELYSEILQLPPEQAASALRWMFGQT
jgi:hypothetical protein